MQATKYILLLLLALLLLPCCTPYTYTYVNPLPNDPAFERGQRAKVGGDVGYLSANVQGSVSPINRVALLGGYSIGYAGQRAYNYGGQLYAAISKSEKGNFYAAFAFTTEQGKMNGTFGSRNVGNTKEQRFDIHLNYTGINWQPSLYFSQNKKEGENYKIGITAKITKINYQKLYFSETLYNKSLDTTTTTFLADANNIGFKGNAIWAYLMYEGKKDRFYVITQLGLTFNSNTAHQVHATQTQYRFKYFPLATATFGIRLWNQQR